MGCQLGHTTSELFYYYFVFGSHNFKVQQIIQGAVHWLDDRPWCQRSDSSAITMHFSGSLGEPFPKHQNVYPEETPRTKGTRMGGGIDEIDRDWAVVAKKARSSKDMSSEWTQGAPAMRNCMGGARSPVSSTRWSPSDTLVNVKSG